ncbi:hypothetical protein PGB90_003242 [Kerria lacca]
MNSSAPFCTRLTDPNDDRKRQINTLKVFNDKIVNKTKFILCNSVSEISSNTEYSVEFTAGENKLAMLIILGPDFPMEKPILKITPSISHQWVNENSEIVSAPGYLNFSVYSDIGRVVQAIIRELQRNPPPLRHKESPISVINKYLVESNTSFEEYEQSFEVMSSVIGRLHKMTLEELKALDEDEDSLDGFVQDLPHVQSLKQTVTDMINETENLETICTELEQKIDENKIIIEEKQKEFEELKESCKILYDKYMKLAEIRAPINVKKRLKQTIVTLDAESESIAESFLESNITLNDFLMQYKALRMKIHAVKVKEDRINQRIQMEKNSAP